MAAAAPDAYWSMAAEQLLARLQSGPDGLSAEEAAARLKRFGPNAIERAARFPQFKLLWRQFGNPLVLILAFGAALSFVLREWTDGAIIMAIVIASGLLGFTQEYRASTALAALRNRLALTTQVRRQGQRLDIAFGAVVPGDIVLLRAGDLIPADGIVLEAKDFLVSEAALTGESLPVEKHAGATAAGAPLAARRNAIHAGTSVRSGISAAVVVRTGPRTALGSVAIRLDEQEPETAFARGVRHFGYLLLRIMFLLVVFVLAVSVLLERPPIESLLFAVALAVGMSPELLPAIITVTLAAGARSMAEQGVIVRRLEAIENLGSIDILCTDKTGTLTEGTVTLAAATDPDGAEAAEVLALAFLNSSLETGIDNPIDKAIITAGEAAGLDAEPERKIDEIPYDFTRKRLTIVAALPGQAGRHLIVTKGAFRNVLAACKGRRNGATVVQLDDAETRKLEDFVKRQGEAGFRVLGLATREVPGKRHYDTGDETDMIFRGFLLLADPVKAGAAGAIAALEQRGIAIKIISGDSRHVVAHVAQALGHRRSRVVTGAQIDALREEALCHTAERTDLFAEVDPQQKERIIRALQKRGHTIGYLGDGINDAPSMHAADVGISVDTAVDVAREAADIILLKRDLDILRLGVESGRRTFANTLKYIAITTSANFGNMVSMALATPFLPFLPLKAKQILLNNFLSDLPSLAIATDRVDAEQVRQAERWDIADIRNFMIVFGLVSTAFDIMTFVFLLKVWGASEALFQTAWFTVSLLTEVVIVLVLRTRAPFHASAPGRLLLVATLLTTAFALATPYLPVLQRLFGFVALPLPAVAVLLLIVCGYVAATELAKRWFYGSRRRPPPDGANFTQFPGRP